MILAMAQIVDNSKAEKRGAYPYYPLPKCLELAGIIRDLGGNKTTVQRSLIAQRMGIEEGAASLSQIIAAAKCFGLIQGWGSFGLTELAKRYFFPTDETEKRKALLAVVKYPTVFEKLLGRYDGGKLPANEMIANVVHRDMGVPESWKARAASLFAATLREAKVLDNAGFVRYGASLHAAEAGVSGESANGDVASRLPTVDIRQTGHDVDNGQKIGDAPLAPQQATEGLALALLAKFPAFDPAWGPEQQLAWFSAYEKLLAMTSGKGGG